MARRLKLMRTVQRIGKHFVDAEGKDTGREALVDTCQDLTSYTSHRRAARGLQGWSETMMDGEELWLL